MQAKFVGDNVVKISAETDDEAQFFHDHGTNETVEVPWDSIFTDIDKTVDSRIPPVYTLFGHPVILIKKIGEDSFRIELIKGPILPPEQVQPPMPATRKELIKLIDERIVAMLTEMLSSPRGSTCGHASRKDEQ